MKLSNGSAYLTGFYVALLVWWLTVFFSRQTDTPFNLAFAFAYGLIPIFGGVLGLIKAKNWGLFKSRLGKALFFLSLGLVSWGMGEMVWSFYNFVLHVEVPYPSWADFFFILSWPLWGVGVYNLSFATGARFGLRKAQGKFILFILPLLAIAFSYYLFVIVARGGSLELSKDYKIFFDIAYPVGDVAILTMATLLYGLSFKFLGGRYKSAVLILLLGFVANYFADAGFSYATTLGTHYNGNWVDLLFTLAMYLMSFGVNNIDPQE